MITEIASAITVVGAIIALILKKIFDTSAERQKKKEDAVKKTTEKILG
jgi:hypothetical protein